MAGSGEAFVHHTRSGGFYSVLLLIAVFPLMLVAKLLPHQVGAVVGTVGLLAILLAALAFYLFYRTEVTVTLGPDVVRLTEQDIAFGVRRERRTLWEFPRPELTSAREVTTRTPSSRGGWDRSTLLHLPGECTLNADALGGNGDPASPYSALVRSLRSSLGDRLVVEDKV